MTTITTRAGKGSPLTNNEMDANLTGLNDDKVEASGDSMTGNLSFGDNNKAIFGAGSDLSVYHDGSNSYIKEEGTGNLEIGTNGGNITLKNLANSETLALFNINSGVNLYYDNSVKLETGSTGIDVTGSVVADSYDIGTLGTLGSVATDRLFIATADGLGLQFDFDNSRIVPVGADGSTYNNNVSLGASGLEFKNLFLSGNATFGDNDKAIFGAGSDLQIYHDGSNSYIDENGVGNLFIRSVNGASARIYSGGTASSNLRLLANSGGEITLYHSGSAKLATSSSGIDVTGNIAVSSAGARRIDISNTSLADTGEMVSLQWDANADLTFQGRASDGTFKANWYRIEASASDGLADAHRFYTDSSAERMSITSTGIDVTGTVTASHLTLSDSFPVLKIEDSDGTNQKLEIVSSSGASFLTARNGSSHGTINLRRTNGTTTSRTMQVTAAGDVALYADDGTTQAFYWDASTSRLGLGETNPSHELHIKSATPQIRLEDSDGTNTYGDMQFNGTSLSLITRGGASSHGVMRFQSTDGTDNLTRMEILSSGDIRFNKDDETLGLRWDASETRLGIGTASPLEELHINAAVPTLRLQDSDGTNQYLNIYESGGGANYLARNNTSYGTHNFYGFDGTTSTSFIGITVDAINQNASAAWYIRNRVNGGSLNLGVETSAGSLYYPVQMNGTSDVLIFNNAEGEMARFSTSGDMEVGSNRANSGAGRYLDIYNRGTDSVSFSILRLITEQVGSTSLSTSEFYKRKNGETTLWNHETSSDAYLRAGIGTTEGWRIHSSGNVLLGKSSPAFGTAGVELNNAGVAGKVWITRSGGEPLALNRLSSDGSILELYKDGTQVGIIGAATGDLTIGTGDTGLTFEDAADVIHPINVSTGAARDNAIDLGKSAARFRDLHLSGRSHSVGITNYTSALRLESLDTSVNAEQSIGDIEFAANDSSSGGTGVQAKISAVSDNAFGTAYALTFQTGSQASPSEKVRIDHLGNLLVGTATTRTGNYSISLEPSNSLMYFRAAGTGSLQQAIFVRDTTGTPVSVGSIATTGTATAYNQSSDERLKENIVDAPSASDEIDAIQVRSFDWKADGSHQKYGMIAQELNTVAPEAVTIPDDPEEMAGVDYSKLVPMLVKEIQSLRARVAQLEGAN